MNLNYISCNVYNHTSRILYSFCSSCLLWMIILQLCQYFWNRVCVHKLPFRGRSELLHVGHMKRRAAIRGPNTYQVYSITIRRNEKGINVHLNNIFNVLNYHEFDQIQQFLPLTKSRTTANLNEFTSNCITSSL